MAVEMFVFESDKAPFHFFGSRFARRETPLPVGGDACAQQFVVPVGYNCGVGDFEQLLRKTKHISCHQKSNNADACFPGGG